MGGHCPEKMKEEAETFQNLNFPSLEYKTEPGVAKAQNYIGVGTPPILF